MATTSITFQTDENVKRSFEKIASEMGVPMTSLLNAFIITTVRAGRVPFELLSDEYAYNQWVIGQLKEAEMEAADPNTKMLSHNEVFGELRKKYKL